ncbi:MAG: hypothetical protein NTX65_03665 [Ignavibacteriales bacterium]|nr:hypothetical protein [Ignavibacteriales bacterium]
MMMTVIDILLIILILSASALCVFAIIYLKRITEQVEALRKDVHEFFEKTNPICDNLEEMSRRIKRVVSEVENYWEEIDSSIKNLRERLSIFTSHKNFQTVVYPAKYLLKNVKALASGTSVFLDTYKKK